MLNASGTDQHGRWDKFSERLVWFAEESLQALSSAARLHVLRVPVDRGLDCPLLATRATAQAGPLTALAAITSTKCSSSEHMRPHANCSGSGLTRTDAASRLHQLLAQKLVFRRSRACVPCSTSVENRGLPPLCKITGCTFSQWERSVSRLNCFIGN